MNSSVKNEFVQLPGSERRALPAAEDAGPVDGSERIELTLVTRRRAEIPEEITESPQMLTSDQLAGQYGTDPADLATIRDVLTRYGLEVTEDDPASLQVKVAGPVSALSQVFGTTLRIATSPDPAGGPPVTHRYRTGSLQVPAELNGIVTAVIGLDNRPQARPYFQVKPEATISGGTTSYTPVQIGVFYNFPAGTDGTGQTLAILELGGGYSQADLTTYFSSLGIAAPAVTAVSVDGATNSPTGNASGPDGEVMLDIEVAGALAPKAAITVYFAPNSSQGFVDALAAAIKANPTAISISWGSSEDSWDSGTASAMSTLFTNAANLGITVCAAAGDHGADNGVGDGALHCVFPASHPYVLACGGTSLTGNTFNSTITAETAWNDGSSATGGGISDQWGMASYQSGAGVPARSTGPARGVPDVAGCADPQTGYQVRVDGANGVIGGTSAVAPLWAALACRLVQRAGKRFGLIHTSLYAGVTPGHSPAGFNDITIGNNNGQYGGYSAGPGWDPCTGLGTPNGSALLTSPQHPVVYVANGGDNTVKVYDPATGAIAASIPAGSTPFEVAVNPAGTQAWVSDNGGGTITIINTAARAVTGTVTLASGTAPTAVVFTPDGTTAYVSDSGNGTIAVVGTAVGTVTSTITVGGDPRDSAITPDGSTVYVADHTQGVVYAISTATHAVTATIAVGSYPAGLAISPDGSVVYAANNGSANVSVISTATNTVTATIPVGASPNSVAFTPSGAAAYVVNYGGNTVSVISTATGTVTATIPVGAAPVNVAFNPAGTTAYVTNYNDNTVSVISTATRTVTGTATGFATPRGITIALH